MCVYRSYTPTCYYGFFLYIFYLHHDVRMYDILWAYLVPEINYSVMSILYTLPKTPTNRCRNYVIPWGLGNYQYALSWENVYCIACQ